MLRALITTFVWEDIDDKATSLQDTLMMFGKGTLHLPVQRLVSYPVVCHITRPANTAESTNRQSFNGSPARVYEHGQVED